MILAVIVEMSSPCGTAITVGHATNLQMQHISVAMIRASRLTWALGNVLMSLWN